jgi:hypothetical protein
MLLLWVHGQLMGKKDAAVWMRCFVDKKVADSEQARGGWIDRDKRLWCGDCGCARSQMNSK